VDALPVQPQGNADTIMVWQHNLYDEIVRIRDVAEHYDHVAMDSQFPGIVARPTGPFSDYALYNYQTLKCNVELTRVLQVGITVSDAKGNRPKGVSTWRFNFKFNPTRDLFAQDSMDLRSLDLGKHSKQGIEPQAFAELLTSSGLVLNEDIRWISYCGFSALSERQPEDAGVCRPGELTFCGMYDFGYMLQLLTSQPLPNDVRGFMESLDLFFPSRCDMAKHLHRLGLAPLNGNGPDARTRSLFRSAHHLIEAFFRLPDSIRRTAHDHEEELFQVVEEHNPGNQRRRQQNCDERRNKAQLTSSGKMGRETNGNA